MRKVNIYGMLPESLTMPRRLGVICTVSEEVAKELCSRKDKHEQRDIECCDAAVESSELGRVDKPERLSE